MSNKKVKSTNSNIGFGYGYVISENAPDRLFGNIFNVIEALGLPSKQEEALKPLIRGEIWKVFEEAVFISSQRHTEIRKVYWEKKKEANNQGVPMSAI